MNSQEFDPDREAQAPWTKGKMPDVPSGPNWDAPEHLEEVREAVNRYRRWMEPGEYRAWRRFGEAGAAAWRKARGYGARKWVDRETEHLRYVSGLPLDTWLEQLLGLWLELTKHPDLTSGQREKFMTHRDARYLAEALRANDFDCSEVVAALNKSGQDALAASRESTLRLRDWRARFDAWGRQ